MRFTALSALWLAATAWAAVDRNDDGNVRSIQVRLALSNSHLVPWLTGRNTAASHAQLKTTLS